MRTVTKFGVVGAGYAAALAAAWGATLFYIASTPHVDRVNESGMTAFGDSVVFLGIFALAGTVPTGAGLYFLRPVNAFWNGLSYVVLAIAATAVAAAMLYATGRATPAGTWLGDLASWSVLRLLSAPLLAIAFGVAALFAPDRRARIAPALAAVIEALSFASFAGLMAHSTLGR